MSAWDAILGTEAALPLVTLILGGARSGKSRLGEALIRNAAVALGRRPHYIATAEALDDEMRDRIAAHRSRRGPDWTIAEAPLDLAEALADAQDSPVLVDCLTLWLSNLMLSGRDPEQAAEALIAAARARALPAVFVSNEVGLGIVPETPLGRTFRDAQGFLNQRMAAAADCAVLVAVGLPLVLKPSRSGAPHVK